MGIEMSLDRARCARCGKEYSRFKGFFSVSYAAQHKGIGHVPVCKDCVDIMYNTYLAQCGDPKYAVRQMCRKLDLYWSEIAYDRVAKKNTTRSMMTQYLAQVSSITYAGKSYDDTLSEEGSLWSFIPNKIDGVGDGDEDEVVQNNISITSDVREFWGPGYTDPMYAELEQRRRYWMKRLSSDGELDVGTEALIRQICSLELDINRDRAAGRSVEKSVSALNTLLGSANLKPNQKQQDNMDAALASTPMGVWLWRYENKRPIPEVDDDLKDVNKILKYVFVWLGHIFKMLGKKGGFTRLYEAEMQRLRVERPEYSGEDDEDLIVDALSDVGEIDSGDDGG